MKKKTIIICICILVLLAIIFIYFFATPTKSNILECVEEDIDGTKTALITYKYTIDENEILQIDSITELKFLNKEEADKYEKIVNIAFFKDEITRENNTITIVSDKSDNGNKLSLEEIKKQQEKQGLECNYK